MENMTLIDRFANPDLIKTMPLGEKMLASLYVTLLGMVITFVALMLLWGMIALMSRILGTKPSKKEKQVVVALQAETETAIDIKEGEIDEAIVAVIAAAVAASMNTSVHNIVVRNIRRTQNAVPAWGNAGRFEQMKTRVQ
jgi:sodium pump decarboxylase gamma subunit